KKPANLSIGASRMTNTTDKPSQPLFGDWNPKRLRFVRLGDWQGGGRLSCYERPPTPRPVNDNAPKEQKAA
ncbi:hypothetical protein AB4144_47030, partial [Rhizobiaceae sp. 2RAB30]